MRTLPVMGGAEEEVRTSAVFFRGIMGTPYAFNSVEKSNGSSSFCSFAAMGGVDGGGEEGVNDVAEGGELATWVA